jgi:pilus assembly protein Flp/PilA
LIKLDRLLGWMKYSKPGQDENKVEEGQGLVEYALVLMLIAIVVISILMLLGPQIGSMFSAVTKGLS